MDKKPSEALTITQAAKYLGVSRKHIYTLIDRGELHPWHNPAYKHGPVLIPLAELEAIANRPT